ncbi:Epoxide hydrolase, partial [Gryllus bimaculatus]
AVCGTNSRNRPRHPARSALGPRPAKPTTPPSCLQEISAIAAQLQELRHRLQTAAALTPPLEDATSAYGFTCAPEQVVSFWRTSTSGRSARPSSTRCAQFKTQVGGLQLHFIHAKPKQVPAGARVLPLLLAARLAGLRARVLRAHPAADGGAAGRGLRVRGGGASLPGYGFSEGAPSGPGPRADGRALPRPHGAPGPQAVLRARRRLGRTPSASAMATLYPDSILGFHTTSCWSNQLAASFKLTLASLYPSYFMTDEEIKRAYPQGQQFMFTLEESGYFHIQATKPDTEWPCETPLQGWRRTSWRSSPRGRRRTGVRYPMAVSPRSSPSPSCWTT